MSLTRSYQGETASASPESPGEGDFSSQQFHDNLKSPEEHETCDDKRGPIVNNAADNYSSSPLESGICASLETNDLENVCTGISPEEQIEKRPWRELEDSSTILLKKKHPASPHFMEVCTLDGRFITLVSTQTQTERERVEQNFSFSCQVQKDEGDLQILHDEMNMDTVPVYLEGTDDDETEEECDIPCLGLPRLIAHRREPKPSLHISKVMPSKPPDIKSENNVHLAPCEYCQKLCQPFTHNDEAPKNGTHFERVFYCEQAKQMRELIQEEREKLELKYSGSMIDVDINTSISRQEWETAKEPQRGRMRRQRKQRKHENPGSFTLSNETSYELLKLEKKIEKTAILTSQEEAHPEPKIKDVKQKFYKTGTYFLIMYSDGTGTVFYPSGKPAIIISSVEVAHFTYIILDDKDTVSNIKGIFTSNGYSTCYHSNGLIWLNLTPGGGLCFSETGDLMRRWNWLYFDPHVRNLPFKPLTLTLGPHISVRIHSQECVYVTFAHKENHVRFSVGSALKLICPESHDDLSQSVLERSIKIKKTEIYSLLDQMQTCMSHPSAAVHNIKPHYRFIVHKDRLSKRKNRHHPKR